MRGVLQVELCREPLSRVAADVALVGVFRNQRPLRGGAGLVDWRLCGFLSSLIRAEQLTGEPDRWILVPSAGRLGVPRVLVGGLGEPAALGSADLRRFAAAAAQQIASLAARAAVLDLASTGQSLSQESAAASIVAGFGETLAARPAELVLHCTVPESELVRWQVVLERTVAKQNIRNLSLRVGPEEPARAAQRPAQRGLSRAEPHQVGREGQSQ